MGRVSVDVASGTWPIKDGDIMSSHGHGDMDSRLLLLLDELWSFLCDSASLI